MAPQNRGPEHTIDRTPEYNDFIAKLAAYHEKRGTRLDPEPKVGTTHVDLLKVFNHVIEHGGYDKVTDEKLAWRKMANGLGLHSNNEAAAAFSLKTVFYKNLAAYELSTIHNKEPPPPEILEHTTAKGGGLLTRTIENFRGNVRRETIGGVDPSDPSGDDATPSRDRRHDEPPGSGRAGRGLREAPPQRVLFQPDTGPTRSRHASAHHSQSAGGTPTSHPSAHAQPHSHPQHLHHPPPTQTPPVQAPQHQTPRGASSIWNPPTEPFFSSVVQGYEPRGPTPLPMRPVDTPGNNPVEFARRSRLLRLHAAGINPAQPPKPGPLPGTGFDGPNIYVRCLCALRSGIPAEQAFALSHLVKISYERGDKYKFDSFPGLAEGLIDKALEVGRLFYHVNWTVSYLEDQVDSDIGGLDGINGTADIVERIAQLQPKFLQDSIQPADFIDEMVTITEAVLTMRNMVMLPENAAYMADFPPLKDLLCIILHLPNSESVVEIKHSALDVAEQLTPFLALDSDDPLYQTLLAQLDSADRGTILTSLRAIGRISMSLEETNKLGEVPPSVLQNIMNWLLLNDDELLDACLDFLYQYTAVVSNVETLLRAVAAENLVSHLVRLLSHGAKRVHKEQILEPERKLPAREAVAAIPSDLLERLVAMEEPERCFSWLRCFFEEDPDSSITQIAIWQAYQQAFLASLQRVGRPIIGAAEFIRNISSVYSSAGAQIIREQGERGEIQKFIIKGIRARSRPINPEGREYFPCLWAHPTRPSPQKCGYYFIDAEKMYDHVLTAHLEEKPGDDKLFKNKESLYRCQWAGCRRHMVPVKMTLSAFMGHVKTHLITVQQRPGNMVSGTTDAQTPGGSAIGSGSSSSSSKRQKRPYVVPAKTISLTYEETLTTRDERNPNAPPQAAGIPLSAVLVLRNIARNVVKTESEEELQKEHEMGGEGGGWNERLFRPMLPRLYEVMTENRALSTYITSLLQLTRDD